LKTLVVVNPHSANGRTGKQWPVIRAALLDALGSFEEGFTTSTGHATDLVRERLTRDGIQRVISVGGDGTNNEVVNGFFDGIEPINKDACLGFVPRGTGGDLRKTLGIGKEFTSWRSVLSAGRTQSCDVGSVEYTAHDGSPAKRLFINITSFGIGGLVDAKVNESTKALGGKASFLIGTIKALAIYRNRHIHLTVKEPDGSVVLDDDMTVNNVAVANGQYFGGGMWVAPEAAISDGLFDVVVLGDMSTFDMVFKASRIYKGTHLGLPEVISARGSRVEATSDEEVLIDMDGEQPGRLPITLEVLPGAINLIVP
jgi:YegS/Rv2252/BmrU family lipid kinase